MFPSIAAEVLNPPDLQCAPPGNVALWAGFRKASELLGGSLYSTKSFLSHSFWPALQVVGDSKVHPAPNLQHPPGMWVQARGAGPGYGQPEVLLLPVVICIPLSYQRVPPGPILALNYPSPICHHIWGIFAA